MNKSRAILIWLVFILFLFDRLLKKIVIHLAPGTSDDFFYFTLYINKSGPFSLALPSVFLIAIATVVLIWLTYLGWQFFKVKNLNRLLGISLMLVGGFSNFWDRVLVGGVIDIWYLSILTGLNFNLADIYLLSGVLILVLSYYRPYSK